MNGSLVFARWRQRAPHLMHASLGPARAQIPNGIWISSATFAQLMAVYNRPPLSPLKIARANRGIWTPSNTWFLGPSWVFNPNGILISIGSAVFAQLTADYPYILQWEIWNPI